MREQITLSKFTDDTEEVDDMPEGCATIQSDLERLGTRTGRAKICSWGGISPCIGKH